MLKHNKCKFFGGNVNLAQLSFVRHQVTPDNFHLSLSLIVKCSEYNFCIVSPWFFFCEWPLVLIHLFCNKCHIIVMLSKFYCIIILLCLTGSLETSMEHFNCADINSTSDGRTEPWRSTCCRNCNYVVLCHKCIY